MVFIYSKRELSEQPPIIIIIIIGSWHAIRTLDNHWVAACCSDSYYMRYAADPNNASSRLKIISNEDQKHTGFFSCFGHDSQ